MPATAWAWAWACAAGREWSGGWARRLREPVVGDALGVGQQREERAVRVAPHHARHAMRAAQRRARAVCEHHAVVQPQAPAFLSQHLDALVAFAQAADGRAHVHLHGVLGTRTLVQRTEEHAAAQAEPKHPRVEPGILNVQDCARLAAAKRPRVDAVDARSVR